MAPPSPVVFIRGLAYDAEEADLYSTFGAYRGIKEIQLLRDRRGAPRGYAKLVFETTEDAQMLMESEDRITDSISIKGRRVHTHIHTHTHTHTHTGPQMLMESEDRITDSISIKGRRVHLEYDFEGAPESSEGPAGGSREEARPKLDWVCDMCKAVNFARRYECFQCHTARPTNALMVEAGEGPKPSNILKISGLEPQIGEPELFSFFAPSAPVVDVRFMRDRVTGGLRGTAFVEFRSIEDAGAALRATRGAAPPGQSAPARTCYALSRERPEDGGSAGAAMAAATAAFGIAAAAAAAAAHDVLGRGGGGSGGGGDDSVDPYAGWQPAEFNEGGIVGGGHQEQQQQQQEQQPGTRAAAAAAAGGQHESQAEAGAASGFQYDEASGFYYDAASGYYYDPRTELYYHQDAQAWLRLDPETQQFELATAPEAGGAAAGAAAAPADAMVGPAAPLGVVGPAGPPQQQQQQQQQQPPQQQQQQQQKPQARRAATIGAAAQLDAQGLLTVVALAEEREKEEQRRRKLQEQRKQQRPAGGSGPAPGGNGGAGQQQQQGAAGRAGAPGAGAVGPSPRVAAEISGAVSGVVYESKWAARQRAGQRGR